MIYFSFDYPPLDGGISRLGSEIVGGLIRRGIDVSVLTQEKISNTGSLIPMAPELRVTQKRPWREFGAIRELHRKSKGSPIICSIWYPEGLLAVIANIHPLVLFAHGSELMHSHSRLRRSLWKIFLRTVFRNADLVLADSEYSLNILKGNVPECNAIAIPLAVDHIRFSPGDKCKAKEKFGVTGKIVLCSVSRIILSKGHEVVFRGIAMLPQYIRFHFTYIVVGRGQDNVILKARAKEIGIENQIRWLNYLPEEDLPDVYRAADLFVLCSRKDDKQQQVEGFGLAFLEAQACGTPVVGTRTGGIADAIKVGKGGWLIDQDDSKALAKILLRLAETPEIFSKAGIIARERIEHECTWDQYIEKLLFLFEQNEINII